MVFRFLLSLVAKLTCKVENPTTIFCAKDISHMKMHLKWVWYNHLAEDCKWFQMVLKDAYQKKTALTEWSSFKGTQKIGNLKNTLLPFRVFAYKEDPYHTHFEMWVGNLLFDQLQERELSELKRRFTHTKIFEEKQTSIKGTLPAEGTYLVVCKRQIRNLGYRK